MIQNEDTPTSPHPGTPSESQVPPTIQVPTVQAAPTIQAPPRPFVRIDDLLTLQVVTDPQISPDGTLIAFTVQHCNPALIGTVKEAAPLTLHAQATGKESENNTTSSAIWLVNSTGGKTDTPWQVTSGEHHDLAPRWSPDGRTLAFLSDRAGSMQIYLLPMSGGEARQLTNLSQGVSEYSWRPDGLALLAHSSWKPEDDQEAADNSAISIVYTRLDERWDGLGYKQGRHQQLWLIPLEGEAVRLTSEPVDLVQSCWSPNGKEIAFCANRRPDPDLSVSMALWVLTLATGEMRQLTSEEGLAQMPAWSPDGHTIAYYYSADQTETSNVSPWIVDAQGNTAPRPASSITQDFTCLELIVDEIHNTFLTRPQWYPNGQELLITVQERGQVHLYRVDVEHNSVTRLTRGNGCYVSPNLSKNGQSIALIRLDWFTPGDIWRMESNGENLHKLTGVNDGFLRSHQLIRPKRMSWQSFDGLEIEGWLYLPPLAEGAKAPLILEVHGGPTLAWGDAYVHEFQVLAGSDYAVLAANPRGSLGYGEEFCKKILNDWGGDDFRDLMAGIDFVIANEAVDGSRLGIGGLSYGGYMTNWAITQTPRFKAAVSRNGISYLPSMALLTDQTLWFDFAMAGNGQDAETLQRSCSALTFVDKITTPLLLLHSGNDLRCPVSESFQIFNALRKRKRIVELVVYPNVSHMMDWPDVGTPKQRTDRLRRTLEWFERFV